MFPMCSALSTEELSAYNDHLICLMEMLEDKHYLPPLTNEDTEAERS